MGLTEVNHKRYPSPRGAKSPGARARNSCSRKGGKELGREGRGRGRGGRGKLQGSARVGRKQGGGYCERQEGRTQSRGGGTPRDRRSDPGCRGAMRLPRGWWRRRGVRTRSQGTAMQNAACALGPGIHSQTRGRAVRTQYPHWDPGYGGAGRGVRVWPWNPRSTRDPCSDPRCNGPLAKSTLVSVLRYGARGPHSDPGCGGADVGFTLLPRVQPWGTQGPTADPGCVDAEGRVSTQPRDAAAAGTAYIPAREAAVQPCGARRPHSDAGCGSAGAGSTAWSAAVRRVRGAAALTHGPRHDRGAARLRRRVHTGNRVRRCDAGSTPGPGMRQR